jgi:transmembrane sensor
MSNEVDIPPGELGQAYERELAVRGFRWDQARGAKALTGTLARVQRRRTIELISFAAAASLLLATGAVATYRWSNHEATATQNIAPGESEQVIHASDGSTITLEGSGSEAHLSDQSPRHIAVQLDKGRGRFEVTKNPERTFEVQSGGVTVTVVGTEFVVERRQDQSFVQVTRGTVRVAWPGGEQLLRAPAESLFPPAKSESVEGPAPSLEEPTTDTPEATRGDNGGSAPTAAALLAAADAARVAGRDDEAMRLLRRVMRDHPSDPQSRMAAFVLGRMLAAKGRNAEAMQAFAEARRSGKLAEEALARQVEVAADSGDRATARRLADEFARAYPKSPRLDAVTRMGEGR